MKTCLIDSGSLVAYLNRRDPAYKQTVTSLDTFKSLLATTGAVVTETMYFVSEIKDGPLSFAKFLLAAGVRVIESLQPDQILAAAELMDRYADLPMDFADGSLVLIAEELAITGIFTLDRRGFSTYKTRKGRPFRLET